MISEILRPQNVEEAVRMKARPGSAYLGGGTWLTTRAAEETTALISLEKLGLAGISASSGSCTMGAAVTLQALVDSAAVPAAIRAAAALTASRTIRNMVTLGGECAFCAEGSALIPSLIALNAEAMLAGKRTPIPVEELCASRTEALILSIVVRQARRAAAVRALSRSSHSRRSVVIAVSAEACAPQLRGVRIVASDCRGARVRLTDVEKELEAAPLPAKARVEELVALSFHPQADMHGSAEYKRYIAGVFAADLLHALVEGRAFS